MWKEPQQEGKGGELIGFTPHILYTTEIHFIIFNSGAPSPGRRQEPASGRGPAIARELSDERTQATVGANYERPRRALSRGLLGEKSRGFQ